VSGMVISALAATLALVLCLGWALSARRSRARNRRTLEAVARDLDDLFAGVSESLRRALEPVQESSEARAAELGLVLDLDELLARLAAEVAARTGADAAAVRVRGPTDEPAVGTFGPSEGARLLDSLFQAPGDRPFRALTVTWTFPPALESEAELFRSALVVPIVEDGVESGAIAGYAREPAAFLPEHARALELLATAAAEGISTARRFTAMRHRAAAGRGEPSAVVLRRVHDQRHDR
jgi:hypothetical protein